MAGMIHEKHGFTGGRRTTVWGSLWPSQYKSGDVKLCSRPGCEKPRDRGEQKYCKACHAEYQRRWRGKAK